MIHSVDASVSNPWREAIEVSYSEFEPKEYDWFPILGGRLLKKTGWVLCTAISR